MRIDQDSQNGRIILHPHGTMDSLVYSQFLNAINQIQSQDCQALLIDLTDVTLVDSMILSGFTLAFRRLHAKGIPMALVNPQPYVLELLSLVKIQKVVPVFTSLENALCSDEHSQSTTENQVHLQA